MLNKVTLIGRLGKDPETRNLPNGALVVNFPVATTEKYKDKTTGEMKETTEWHNLELWDNLGKIAAQYLKKGSLAYFEGKIKTNTYEKDGKTQYMMRIQVAEMKMLGGNPNSGSSNYSQSESYSSPDTSSTSASSSSSSDSFSASASSTASDDLPF